MDRNARFGKWNRTESHGKGTKDFAEGSKLSLAFVAVGPALSDFSLMARAGTAMSAGDIGFLLGLRLYFLLLCRALQFGTLESDAALYGLLYLIIADLSLGGGHVLVYEWQ